MADAGPVGTQSRRQVARGALLGALVCAAAKAAGLAGYALLLIATDYDRRDYIDRWLGKANPTGRSSTLDLGDGVILLVLPTAAALTGLLPGAVAGALGAWSPSRRRAAWLGGAAGLLGVGHAIFLTLFWVDWQVTRPVAVIGVIGLLAGAAAGLAGHWAGGRAGR